MGRKDGDGLDGDRRVAIAGAATGETFEFIRPIIDTADNNIGKILFRAVGFAGCLNEPVEPAGLCASMNWLGGVKGGWVTRQNAGFGVERVPLGKKILDTVANRYKRKLARHLDLRYGEVLPDGVLPLEKNRPDALESDRQVDVIGRIRVGMGDGQLLVVLGRKRLESLVHSVLGELLDRAY